MRSSRHLLILLSAVYTILAATAGGSSPASSAGEQTAVVSEGREVVAFFSVPVEKVRPYVPDHYELQPLAPGLTTIVVRTAEYPSVTLSSGAVGRLRTAYAVAEIVPPDSTGTVNWYTIFWANDNLGFNNDFLRKGTPSYPAVDAPGLACSLTNNTGTSTENCVGDDSGGLYEFQALLPTTWSFEMTAALSGSPAMLDDVTANIWRDVPEGTVRISSHITGARQFQVAPSAVTVSTEPASPLAELLGSSTRTAEVALTSVHAGYYDKVIVDTETLLPLGEPEAASDCTAVERRQFLAQEQARILDLMRNYGNPAADLTTLRDEGDLGALAAGDPDSGTMYSLLTHQFVSFGGMGVAVFNTGAVGPGKPDLLFYAPGIHATNVTDPYGADFPYMLAGWAYVVAYDHEEHPTFLGQCLARGDWFLHERGIHPADDWTMLAVPPHEVEHGQDAGQDPILPTECVEGVCPSGLPHPRFWDIHFWLAPDGEATPSILTPHTEIAGIDPGLGTNFFYPDGGTVRETNCDVVDNVVRVPSANVRPLVPDEFKFAEAVPGMADLFIGGVHCQGVSINGGPPRETTWAYFRVAINDPNQKEPAISDVLNSELAHSYQFWLASDNPEHVAFLRSEGGVSPSGEASRVVHVGQIHWDFDPSAETFSMQVPPPAPSPFRIEATITERLTPPGDVTTDHWAAVPRGVMELPDDNLDGLTSGFSAGQVFPEEGSDMDLVFCDDTDGSFGVETGSLTLFFANSSYTAVIWKPSDLFGVEKLSDTGPATCNPGT